MRILVAVLAICIAGSGCTGQSSTKHSRWYDVAYQRCSRMFQEYPMQVVGPGTMVVPPGTLRHWREWQAGCAAAARRAGYLALRNSGS